jgi:two-component system sensor histidine kinase/response regulator
MKILIIEDDADIRHSLQELLQCNQHEVLAAACGAEGIKLAETQPDLIFCDIGMPGMDGYEVIAAIHRLPNCVDIPFIYLTARADRDDQRRAMNLGADDFITKPFYEKDILEAIAARIRCRQPLRERIAALVTARRCVARANWSHELMTPLNGVLGGLQLIEAEAERIRPEELKDLLGLIRSGAERQYALARQLVLYFELEQRKATPASATAARCTGSEWIATGAAAAAALHHQQRNADLTVQCDPVELPLDGMYLSAAVTELVDNAFRFSRPGQRVTVTGAGDDSCYRIVVADQGPGMTEALREAIGPFVQFRAGGGAQRGLGLGLAIARSVAELSGGSFSLQSNPVGGLLVAIDLPCALPPCARETSRAG